MLKKALNSVLNQNKLSNKVIIIDGYSGPPAIVNDFSLIRIEANFKLTRNDRSRVTNNVYNQNAAEASQDTLMFLDDGDTYKNKSSRK